MKRPCQGFAIGDKPVIERIIRPMKVRLAIAKKITLSGQLEGVISFLGLTTQFLLVKK